MLHRHDAVGEHTRSLRDLLVAAGVPSHIYSEIPDPATAGETRPYLDYESEAEAGDVLVYQFATYSAMAEWVAARPEPLVINYHSITPPEYFGPWNNAITRLQVGARADLDLLAPGAALGIAVSHFDADELGAAGCSRTTVIPVVNVQVPPVEPDRATLDRLRERWSDRGGAWLSVGRLAPNKAHQQAIAALFVARATSDPGAHLALVGSPSEPAYAAALRRYASSLGLADAVEFVSGVSDAELAAHYRAADVLVMLSEHEGFGVPLVEAMGHGLPILAFRAGAVPEILGDAGILLDHKGPRRVAEAACELTSDSGERDRLVEAGMVRLRALDLGGAGKLLVEAVQGVSASGATGP
jgi:glycosyltransferase involved in cell wall biosynthesis